MKIVAIVQSRMGSTRLPNKAMKPIGGRPMIELLLERLARSAELNQIVVATSTSEQNQPLVDHVEKLDYVCVRGSEDDVLDRFVTAARQVGADVVVRITGDCPLIDPNLVDAAIQKFIEGEVDYLSNTVPATYPDGLDIEVFSASALERANREAYESFDREHVTPYLRRPSLFKTSALINEQNLSSIRWTVDEPADFEVISQVFDHFAPDTLFPWESILAFSEENPDLFALNSSIARNEGATMSKGQKLWKRAKAVIPGGNMLLSKRAEMFAPEQWPVYFSKAKGCVVWDLDGKQYTDM